MAFSLIDIMFLVTVALLVFNGLRNGAVFSLVNLLSIPIGIAVVVLFGPQFTRLLAANGLSATPLIAYAVLFFGAVFILHIIGTSIRGVVRKIPIIGFGDSLAGGVIGFVEAWLLWLFLLMVLGSFLGSIQSTVTQTSHIVPGLNIQIEQLKNWHDFYNQAVTNSIFARVNGFFVKELPNLPRLSQK
jgi:uncharacterized membrane protein required for colicin V production